MQASEAAILARVSRFKRVLLKTKAILKWCGIDKEEDIFNWKPSDEMPAVRSPQSAQTRLRGLEVWSLTLGLKS